MSRAPELDRRFPRVSARVRYGYRNHAPQLFGLILCSLFVGCVLLIGGSLGRPSDSGGIVPVPAPRPPPIAAQRGPVIHANLLGGYAFAYPRTWIVSQAGAQTELVSPHGETVVSFITGETPQVGDNGADLSRGQALLRSLGSIVEPSVLGTAWQQIAGHRSFLVSGTADDPVGGSIRFLVIGVPGERPTHVISIVVPADSDPSRMLRRVERIVASFDLLDEASTDGIALVRS
jgi:hypothetical protein